MGVTNKTYSEKLKNANWQKKRLEILSRDNWTCLSCGRNCLKEGLLAHVHHIKYLHNLEPWEYENNYLATYCELCHNTEHLIGGQINEILIELIRNHAIFIKPVSQICTLVEKWPEFQKKLKAFLDESMIFYLSTSENPAKRA
jgi:5-methylcytosine-specific restriction endonuclease McrA